MLHCYACGTTIVDKKRSLHLLLKWPFFFTVCCECEKKRNALSVMSWRHAPRPHFAAAVLLFLLGLALLNAPHSISVWMVETFEPYKQVHHSTPQTNAQTFVVDEKEQHVKLGGWPDYARNENDLSMRAIKYEFLFLSTGTVLGIAAFALLFKAYGRGKERATQILAQRQPN